MNESLDITGLLARARGGDATARDQLFAGVYALLRKHARRALAAGGEEQTLDTTALVHETYLSLAGCGELPVADRACFFAYAATSMRNILVDHARRRHALKRASVHVSVHTDSIELPVQNEGNDVLALDSALSRLAAVDAQLAHVVELRWFAGLSVDETAELLGRAPRSVDRDWQKARAFLQAALA